jgi:transposase
MLYERCAGVDVHKRTVVVTVLLTQEDGRTEKEPRTFGTMTGDLLEGAGWLERHSVTQVALESTGGYGGPVDNLLEQGRTIVLVNPQHMKAVPGRTTALKESEWLADLLRHGLLTASFIPPQPIRALRALTRSRKTLFQQRAQQANRLQKVLESATLKLASVATDVLGPVVGRCSPSYWRAKTMWR